MSYRSCSSDTDMDSGYSSGGSADNTPHIFFSKPHLRHINRQLEQLEPADILKWCITSLPKLYQISAFGLTGLAVMDMVSKLDFALRTDIEMIFVDTLYHFPQTLELVDRVRQRYPHLSIHTFKPRGCDTVADFEARYGERFWEADDEAYDAAVKVEPAQRAYAELNVKAVLTGRRRSQNGRRDIPVLEIDDTGLIKVNPLANWSFQKVQAYVREHNVPTNNLLDQGYRSVGDWHSTQPVDSSEDERAGRWRGRQKTECGIHNKHSRYAMFLEEQARQQELERQQEEQRLSEAIQYGLKIDCSA